MIHTLTQKRGTEVKEGTASIGDRGTLFNVILSIVQEESRLGMVHTQMRLFSFLRILDLF